MLHPADPDRFPTLLGALIRKPADTPQTPSMRAGCCAHLFIDQHDRMSYMPPLPAGTMPGSDAGHDTVASATHVNCEGRRYKVGPGARALKFKGGRWIEANGTTNEDLRLGRGVRAL